MTTPLPHLIWIDCEMTGLDLASDALVEIAVLVTDSDLNVIGDGVDLVIATTPEKLAGMNEYVTQMHTTSGLITEIPNGVTASQAEDAIIKYLESTETVAGKSPLREIQLVSIATSSHAICPALTNTCTTEPSMFHRLKSWQGVGIPRPISQLPPRPATIARWAISKIRSLNWRITAHPYLFRAILPANKPDIGQG
jgi:hypothetical protein